ncbi:hypothetical protein [Halomicrobium urmianum]|nr:hypothetical protein [Halomicrobium urmianum]
MTRTEITLRGDDTERFEEIRQRIAAERPGSEPCNAEVVRVMMDDTRY